MDIVLCDDHEMVMESIGGLLEAHGHRVSATTPHPSTLPALVEQHAPDVCVTDLLFAGEDSPGDILPAITRIATSTDVVVLTGVSDPDGILAAQRAGAAAVGSKALPSKEILALVEGRAGPDAPDARREHGQQPFFLTDREVEVLQCLSDGDSTARMAETLGVRHATARSHVQSVLLKLGVHSRTAAVAVGVQQELVEVVR